MFHGSSGSAGGQNCPTHVYQDAFPKAPPPRWSEWVEFPWWPAIPKEQIEFSIPLSSGVASLLFPEEK